MWKGMIKNELQSEDNLDGQEREVQMHRNMGWIDEG